MYWPDELGREADDGLLDGELCRLRGGLAERGVAVDGT